MFTYSHTSFHRGRHVEGCWVFGGIERLEPTSDNKLMQEKLSFAKKKKALKHNKHVAGEIVWS